MNEADWLNSRAPGDMLIHIRGKESGRKLRLFAVACCRRIPYFHADLPSRAAADAAESYADNLIALPELLKAFEAVRMAILEDPNETHAVVWDAIRWAAQSATFVPAWEAAVQSAAHACRDARWGEGNPACCMAHANLLREIIGNPFVPWIKRSDLEKLPKAPERPETPFGFGSALAPLGSIPVRILEDSWLTPTVVQMAQTIYNDRDFEHLPILADPLQEAGCFNEDILDHCRAQGQHVRGCWLVDLLLGKE